MKLRSWLGFTAHSLSARVDGHHNEVHGRSACANQLGVISECWTLSNVHSACTWCVTHGYKATRKQENEPGVVEGARYLVQLNLPCFFALVHLPSLLQMVWSFSLCSLQPSTSISVFLDCFAASAHGRGRLHWKRVKKPIIQILQQFQSMTALVS